MRIYCIHHHWSSCELPVPLSNMRIHCIHHYCSLNSLYPPSRWDYIVFTIIALWTHCTLLQDEITLYPPPFICELTVPFFKMRLHCIHHYCSLNSLYPSSRWDYIVSTTIDLWTHCTLLQDENTLYPPLLLSELIVPLFKMGTHCIAHHCSLYLWFPAWRWDYIVSTTIDLWTNFTLIEDANTFYLPSLICKLTIPFFKMSLHCIHHYCSLNSLYPFSRWEYIVSTIIDLWTSCTLLKDEIKLYPAPLFCELTVPFFKMRIHCIHHYWSVNSNIVSTT